MKRRLMVVVQVMDGLRPIAQRSHTETWIDDVDTEEALQAIGRRAIGMGRALLGQPDPEPEHDDGELEG